MKCGECKQALRTSDPLHLYCKFTMSQKQPLDKCDIGDRMERFFSEPTDTERKLWIDDVPSDVHHIGNGIV